MINLSVFEPMAISSLENYVQTDVGNDFLVTLTDRQYHSPEAVIAEGHNIGHFAKRVPYIPKGFRLGLTRIFISFFWTKEDVRGLEPIVFAYFVADGIDLIVPSDPAQIDLYREYASVPGINLLPYDVVQHEPERSFGRRDVGQIYLTSDAGSSKMAEDIEKQPELFRFPVEAGIAVLRHPIGYDGEYFRTVKHFKPESVGIKFSTPLPSLDDIVLKARERVLGAA